MDIFLPKIEKPVSGQRLELSGSKSESNRLLVLQQFFPKIMLSGLSHSDDTRIMQQALASQNSIINIGQAGTCMRFLTAYFAVQEGREVELTGSERMCQRPVKILVEALKSLGASIYYTKREGFPPLRIIGKKISGGKVTVNPGVSSQFVSALLLIAPTLPKGLTLYLQGNKTSEPYLKMTISLLQRLGVDCRWEGNTIQVSPFQLTENKFFTIESDWSSASYLYSILALSPPGTNISLSRFTPKSLQGDAVVAEVYRHFGVKTDYDHEAISLTKIETTSNNSELEMNLIDYPDLAQTVAVTCLGLKRKCRLTGLHTLKDKETNRLKALQSELRKLAAHVKTDEDNFMLCGFSDIKNNIVEIQTYNDHRMAMSFAPIALQQDLIIRQADVVSKSYPNFWNDLKTLGFQVIVK